MQFDFNVGPGQSQRIDVVGSFVKYKNGTGTIRVRLNSGGYIDLLPGQGVNNVNFTGIDVQDRTGAQNAGTILAGIYDFRDDRISGSVEVIDGGKARTKADIASMGYAYCSTSDATFFTHVQLYNPVGSTKNLFIGQVGFYSNVPPATAPSGVQIAEFSTPLGTFYGYPARKRIGAPNSVAEMRVTANGIRQITGTILAAIDSTQKLVRFSEPIMLAPGRGIVVAANNVNETIGAYFEFVEEPV